MHTASTLATLSPPHPAGWRLTLLLLSLPRSFPPSVSLSVCLSLSLARSLALSRARALSLSVKTCHPVASTPRRLALDLELLLELCHALDAERGIENNQVLAKVESADAEVEAAVKVGWC